MSNYSRTIMELVEPILSGYTNPIGCIDISTLSNSGTGYFYAKVIDDYTIARIMCNDNCIGYNIQINEYSTGSKRRDALLFTHRPEKLGFNFDGCKQFYHNCYVDSSNVTNVINNFNQLVTKGSVNISNECFDFDSKTWKTFTNKFELATMP